MSQFWRKAIPKGSYLTHPKLPADADLVLGTQKRFQVLPVTLRRKCSLFPQHSSTRAGDVFNMLRQLLGLARSLHMKVQHCGVVHLNHELLHAGCCYRLPNGE